MRGKLDREVVGYARHARLVADIFARLSRGCYAENGPVEFKLISKSTRFVCYDTLMLRHDDTLRRLYDASGSLQTAR